MKFIKIQISIQVQAMKLQEEVYFNEQTDSFKLSVVLRGDRLIIRLKDSVDWIIYQREYSEEDIGKQISRKMELMDVYSAFTQTKPQCDEERMKEKQHQGNQLKRYEFGTVVENMNERLPCYKIEKDGRITVYLSMFDKRAKKDVTYESMLILDKIKEMTEAEISMEKLTKVNNHTIDELKREVHKEKKEKEELVKQVIKLEEENNRCTEKLTTTEKELQVTKKKLADEISKKTELESIINELIIKQGEFKKKFWKQLKEENESNAIVSVPTLSRLRQAYINKFQVDELKLKFLGFSDETQYIFNEPIFDNQNVNFKIRITKSQLNKIMVGVVDYAKQKQQRSSYNSGNAMCYLGKNGQKYPQKEKEGDGFKQGDVVEVQVNRTAHVYAIKYIVNGVCKATSSNSMLADDSRVFMPYVEMHDHNDEVEWVL